MFSMSPPRNLSRDVQRLTNPSQSWLGQLLGLEEDEAEEYYEEEDDAVNTAAASTMGFVFNIENVAMRNGDVPPEVAGVIGSLVRRGIPVAYVTNASADGGFGDVGQKEALVARMLDHAVPVSDYQVCMRHAPFRYLVKTLHLGDRNVLMVGGHGAQGVHRLAAACGFGKAWTPVTFRGASAVQIAAIVVLSAPGDPSGDLELVGSILASSPETRLYVCNEDFERATNFQFPAINYSAFMKMLADYWRARHGASR
ncbi:hypothetical protein B0T26DRAFT_269088 [Lasiosphaeria miniovina]|uniref:Uncharacterized protein n=1 Tax=Lasiosphaeria miniovina TaxID=1954250 RepID=A0AA40DUJ1_9PEZI|nr:uncharacterized protein B0T26DRAFT_269088 [Lasiosphaeria miniovina]KAK0716899.1 hypothetical protein B0T26DRAFT_269088 [Lasiosphaeria miniovina]